MCRRVRQRIGRRWSQWSKRRSDCRRWRAGSRRSGRRMWATVIPGASVGVDLDRSWALVLAYIVLRALPRSADSKALLEALDIRAALAEAFSELGIQGEDSWRFAARVHMLLECSGSDEGVAHGGVLGGGRCALAERRERERRCEVCEPGELRADALLAADPGAAWRSRRGERPCAAACGRVEDRD